MSWDNGTIGGFLAEEQYKTGRVGSQPIQANIAAARAMQASQDQPVPTKTALTNANGTAQTARSSAGRLYHVRVTNTDNDAIVVVLTDGGNTIVVGGLHCPAGSTSAPAAAECSFFAGNHGNGQVIITDLRVRAFKSSDGTTAADTGNTVTVLHSAA